jgi:hypothetical protein
MENIEITTSEVETAAVNTAEEATESSEQGMGLGEAALLVGGIAAACAAAASIGKAVYKALKKKLEPKITENQIDALIKKGYVVYKLEDVEAAEEADIAEESEDDSIENE